MAADADRLGPRVVCGGTATDWHHAYLTVREVLVRGLDPTYAQIVWPTAALPIYRPLPRPTSMEATR